MSASHSRVLPRRLPPSLVILIQALTGSKITVEVRNNVHVTGILDSVDANMNLTLSLGTQSLKSLASSSSPSPQTSQSSSTSTHETLDILYIASRHITFIHLPDQLDVFETVDNHINKLQTLTYSNTGGKRRRRE